MRLGIIDVGSNTVHVAVVDGFDGGPPLPTFSAKSRVRLAETVDTDGTVLEPGLDRLVDAVGSASDSCTRHDVDEVYAFATATVREAPNRDDIRKLVAAATGIDLQILTGEDEARLTFAAARRWFGWSAGPMVLVDIGGGSLEIAAGQGEHPAFAASYPLGAGRMTREWLPTETPSRKQIAALRGHVKDTISDAVTRLRWEGRPQFAAATSKTFRQLARLAGAAPARRGPFVARHLDRTDLKHWANELATMAPRRRGRLAGMSRQRAQQIVAGAVVAHTALKRLDIPRVEVCPWALREGITLDRLGSSHH
jgi:exopolyphosphatase / guanosine-5'-triphosphate,3'-diphosphate pyrophosphatase